MAFANPPDEVIRGLLSRPLRIAMVGCSADPRSDSYRIAQLLIRKGHDVVPVNPHAAEILGRRSYPSLRDVPGAIDVVDVFRRSQHLAAIVEDAIEKGARVVWTQLGIDDEQAAARAAAAGITVIMDRCPSIEYRRLFQ